MSKYRTHPDPKETGWPAGVPYIIGNEGCERFSFYGMKSILQVHLTILFALQLGLADTYEAAEAFINGGSDAAKAAGEQAQVVVHLFVAGVYALPMIGAILADRFAGKYNTIIWLSLVYCLGHAVLAVGENSLLGMYIGLGLIAVGSGGIKPCVSANVGDQFGKGNWHLVERVFQAFYWIINFGSFFATLAIPWLRTEYGNSVAFGLPGVLMFVATVVFWMGRDKFVHADPQPGGRLGLYDTISSTFLFLSLGSLFFTATMAWYVSLAVSVGCLVIGFAIFAARQRIEEDDGFLAVMLYSFKTRMSGWAETYAMTGKHTELGLHRSGWFSAASRRYGENVVEGPVAVLRILSIFVIVGIFWSLFDQHASSWIRQGQMMNQDVGLLGMTFKLLPEQFQAANPLLVMGFIPLCGLVIYPGITKMGFKMTALRRMTIGFYLAAGSYVVMALLQVRIENSEPGSVSIWWQAIPYVVLTLGEVMLSVTGLEFAYTQAPPRMKSTIMGFWLLSVSLGSILVAIVTSITSGIQLSGSFWMWAFIGGAAATAFGARSFYFKVRDYSA